MRRLVQVAVLTCMAVAGTGVVLPASGVSAPTPSPPSSLVGWSPSGAVTSGLPAQDDLVQVSTSASQGSFARRADGSLVAWGSASSGFVSGTPSGTGFQDVDGGYFQAAAVRADGSLAVWGNPGNTANLNLVPPGNDFVDVTAGFAQGLAVREDGSLVRWGSGNGPVPAGNDFVAVEGTQGFNVALREDGSLVSWGASTSDPAPVMPTGTFRRIALSRQESCGAAIATDGSLANLGTNAGGFRALMPTGNDFVDVAASNACRGAALRADGSIVTWGSHLPPPYTLTLPADPAHVAVAVSSAGTFALRRSTPTDTAAPEITLTTPAAGATYDRGASLTADYGCTDATGVQSCTGDVADGAAVDTSVLGPHTFTVTATDTLGNTTSRTAAYEVVDRTAPTVTVTSPGAGAGLGLGEVATADFSCADDTALASCIGTPAFGERLDTGSPGSRQLSVTARDTSGNETTTTRGYAVSTTLAGGLGLTGSVLSAAPGLTYRVVDAPHPDGVVVTTGPGSGTVRFSVCGGFTVAVAADSEVTLTCGSVLARVTRGSALLTTPDGAVTATVGAGASVELDADGDLANRGGVPVTVTQDGVTQTVAGGGSATWRAAGFYAPVDVGGVWNTMKAGSTVPLKFELFYGGTEIVRPGAVQVVFTRTTCSPATEDAVEELTGSGELGLRYVDGAFHQNWKSPKTPGACYRATASSGGASTTAWFKLR